MTHETFKSKIEKMKNEIKSQMIVRGFPLEEIKKIEEFGRKVAKENKKENDEINQMIYV